MLIMSAFVPISLTFTLEMVKYFQGWRLNKIQIMKTYKTNNAGQVLTDEFIMPKANNPALNEELGQVFHIFTDKTGTLTSNLMTFNRLLLGRYEFCKKVELTEEEIEEQVQVDEIDKAFIGILQEDSPDGEKCRFALRCLALNNNVNYQEDNTPTSKSPEELEFVTFCKKYNYNYQAPDQQKGDTFDSEKLTYILEEEHQEQLYEHLDKIEFTSDRKMMSTIVRMCPRSKESKYQGSMSNANNTENIDLQDKKNGDIYMFTKGADDVIS
jgi:phospholipid-translocating ATPase